MGDAILAISRRQASMVLFSLEAEHDLDRLMMNHPHFMKEMIACLDEVRLMLMKNPMHPLSDGYQHSCELRRITGIDHRILSVIYRYFPEQMEVVLLGFVPNW
jgi:hypothetical protein